MRVLILQMNGCQQLMMVNQCINSLAVHIWRRVCKGSLRGSKSGELRHYCMGERVNYYHLYYEL